MTDNPLRTPMFVPAGDAARPPDFTFSTLAPVRALPEAAGFAAALSFDRFTIFNAMVFFSPTFVTLATLRLPTCHGSGVESILIIRPS
jgi:hypothetical protein